MSQNPLFLLSTCPESKKCALSLRSCSRITGPSQHILPCQLVWVFTLSGSFMGTDEDPWLGFFAMKHKHWKTQLSATSSDGLFRTLSSRFSYCTQIDKNSCTQLPYIKKMHFFFYLGFPSQPFTNHRTAGEGGGHFFNSSLPLPPASHTLRF